MARQQSAGRRATLFEDEQVPQLHPNVLWIAIPDVVGDAAATLERFRESHVWLSRLPLAFVLQDRAQKPAGPRGTHPGKVWCQNSSRPDPGG